MIAMATLPEMVCPDCGGSLIEHDWSQPALIRHGGYGATERTVRRVCRDCSWSVVTEVGATKP